MRAIPVICGFPSKILPKNVFIMSVRNCGLTFSQVDRKLVMAGYRPVTYIFHINPCNYYIKLINKTEPSHPSHTWEDIEVLKQ